MTPHNKARFADLVAKFIDGCGIDNPFHLVAIAENGSVAVTRHTESDIEELCSHMVEPGMIAPVTLTVIAADGRGTSARISIEAGRAVMQ